ncbi:MAG TPA: tetratricopeptide repeat protein [Tenuifilaceae bacterium]|nr:tetratricopeptide repeat protein [Tenuifilaceae bacterium]HPJ44851.1 tetratricopeptide repeat protein [Tenuifilaceae bacterium]HPQ32855.1 tetratricopeptide repeat protein [Tenuifilaceae bacterium]HRX67216.1 tetratricopeptide repeat protein [Tenuifilaceae bacterium]
MKIKYFRIFFSTLIILNVYACKTSNIFISKNQYETSVGPYIYYYEGVKSRLIGRYNDAIILQNKSISIDSANSAPYYELSLVHGSLNNNTSAIKYLEKAISLEESNKFYRNYLGILYINENRMNEALKNQIALVMLDSLNPSYKYSLALLYNDIGQKKKSIELLEQITNQSGFNPQIADTKIKILFELNDLSKASNEIDKLTSLFPNVALYQLYGSELSFRQGNDSLGLVQINNAIDLEPTNSFIKVNKYLQLKNLGNVKESINYLNELSQDSSISSKSLIDLFYPILYEPTYYSLYSDILDNIIINYLHNYNGIVEVHALAYEHFLNTRNFSKARQQLAYMIQYDNMNSDNWEKAISFDFSTSSYVSAINLSQQAQKLFPQKDIFYILQALSLDNIGNTLEAIATLKKATRIINSNEINSEMHATIADLCHKINRNKEAYKNYEKSIKLNPKNARSLNNYSYYLSIERKKLRKALKMSTRAVLIEPNNSTYIDTKGWVLFQMERYNEAKEVLQNAVAKDGSKSPVIIEHYADALFLSGNKEAAYIYWLKARDLGGNSLTLQKKIELKNYVEE